MASKKQHSPAAYNDVKFVLDKAIEKPGLRYEFQTHGPAIHFKQRCNRYRNLIRDMLQEQYANMPGFRAETAYDILVIRQQNTAGEPDRRGTILVFDHMVPTGKIIDPETGEEIKPDLNIPLVSRT